MTDDEKAISAAKGAYHRAGFQVDLWQSRLDNARLELQAAEEERAETGYAVHRLERPQDFPKQDENA